MRKRIGVGLLAVVIAGCASSAAPASSVGGVGPALAVERFLQAANTVAQSRTGTAHGLARVRQELDTMIRLFGTTDRTIAQLSSREDAERRMSALSDLLRHEDFRIEGSRIVPGRSDDAVDVLVRMQLGSRAVTVPFTVVQAGGAGWRIERIDLQPLVSSSG